MADEHSSLVSNPNPKSEVGMSNITSLTENSILPITGYKINGQNYTHWARSVRIFFPGKGKEDYITGDAKEPEKEDPSHPKWRLENSLVMSWLLNSMTSETGENFMYYGTTLEIWSAAKETYSNNDNTSAIF
ncbi:Gag-polypeptide of LTR copia-type [Sesbania bispinosa]|nr:Gag-polypeptide of LTR copia-type [Sesbania bispinosa]